MHCDSIGNNSKKMKKQNENAKNCLRVVRPWVTAKISIFFIKTYLNLHMARGLSHLHMAGGTYVPLSPGSLNW